jgi:hypothetical protein
MAQEQDKQDLRDQANRLWQHGLHEDSVLNERQNYFLIAESMLLVGYTTVLSTPQPKVFIARVIASFGMLLTLVWIYVNIRQWYIVKHVRARAVEVLPDYRLEFCDDLTSGAMCGTTCAPAYQEVRDADAYRPVSECRR